MMKLLLLFCYLFLISCQTPPILVAEKIAFEKRLQQTQNQLSEDAEKNQQSYIKIIIAKEAILDKKISRLLIQESSLREILNLIFTDTYIITEGNNVDLEKQLSVDVKNINYAEFLELLSSLSTYRIYLEKSNKLVVSSVAYRRWNVASLVSLPEVNTRVGTNESIDDITNSTRITLEKDDKVWEDLLAGLKKILGREGVIVDNRRLGEIYASGHPDKLILADQWMKKIVHSSTRQVSLDVAILEISLNDGQATGLDWDAVYTRDANRNITISSDAPQVLTGSNNSAWGLVANYAKGKFKLTALVNLLKRHGKVSVQHQPSLTVTNGATAYLGSTDKFSYISGIERERLIIGSVIQTNTTIETEEVNIGVNIAVTVRLLDNDEILIEVVPVISSLQGFDEVLFPDQGETQSVSLPRITLQELSTQVITKSGQAIHLGGLVIEKLTEESAKTPFASKILGFLNSQKQQLEKKEILVIITPTEV